MRIVFRRSGDPQPGLPGPLDLAPPPAVSHLYPQRPSVFLSSLLFHAAILLAIALSPPAQKDKPERLPPQTVTMLPRTPDKVIWYPAKKPQEAVTPVQQGDTPKPQGREVSPRETLVSVQPKAPERRQLVWQPETPAVLEREVDAPNLIALAPTPAPKAPPKVFVPPPERAAPAPAQPQLTEAVPVLRQADTLIPNPALPVAAIAGPAKPKPKDFVPPPSRAPQGTGTATSIAEAPPELRAAGGTANVSTVILGLDPKPNLVVDIPKGSRSAQFSRAPQAGEPSTGQGTEQAKIKLPGIRMNTDVATPPPPPVPKPAPRKLIVEVPLPPPMLTTAAPLWPNSRNIPRLVEAKFTQRVVYTTVVPKPNLAAYTGDWVIWFSQLTPQPMTDRAQVRPPMPVRKYEDIGARQAMGAIAESWVQLTGIVGIDGRIRNLATTGRAPAGLLDAAKADVASWEFRPAMRNTDPIEVEVLIEIPFRGPAAPSLADSTSR